MQKRRRQWKIESGGEWNNMEKSGGKWRRMVENGKEGEIMGEWNRMEERVR